MLPSAPKCSKAAGGCLRKAPVVSLGGMPATVRAAKEGGQGHRVPVFQDVWARVDLQHRSVAGRRRQPGAQRCQGHAIAADKSLHLSVITQICVCILWQFAWRPGAGPTSRTVGTSFDVLQHLNIRSIWALHAYKTHNMHTHAHWSHDGP